MRKLMMLCCGAIFLASCSTNNTPTTCGPVTGTKLCFAGEEFTFATTYWENVGNHLEVELEPSVGPGMLIGCTIVLGGTQVTSGDVPVVGTYVNVFDQSASDLQFSVVVVKIENSVTSVYNSIITEATNTLSITSFTGNAVSGNGSVKVANVNNASETYEATVSFENLPFQ